MRIGIIRCGSHSENCSATSCLQAAREGKGHFRGISEVVAMDTCGGCQRGSADQVLARVRRHQAAGAEVIHLSNCLASACPWKETWAEAIGRKTGLQVLAGTH